MMMNTCSRRALLMYGRKKVRPWVTVCTTVLSAIAIAVPIMSVPALVLAEKRLGLHVTQEELAIWRQRMTDTGNGVGGLTYQTIYRDRILADASAFRNESHPGGDGYWSGPEGTGCVPGGTPVSSTVVPP